MKPTKKILLFKIGAFGDVLMTAPLLQDVFVKNGRRNVDFLVGNSSRDAVLEPYTDCVLTFDENIFFKRQIGKILKLVHRIRKREYDVIFVLDKHWIFNIFAKLCGIPKRIGFDRNGEGIFLTDKVVYKEVKHEIDYYKSMVRFLNKTPSPNRKIEIIEDYYPFYLPEKFICIAIGGGNNIGEKSNIRKFPMRKMGDVINSLDYPIVLVGGKEDNKNFPIILGMSHILNLIGTTTWRQTADIMSRALLVICNDSGAMHVASATNDYIISIFGPTNPARKAPLNKKAVAIWKDQDIYEEDYELYGKLPADDKIWFSEIEAQDVLKEVKKMLANISLEKA